MADKKKKRSGKSKNQVESAPAVVEEIVALPDAATAPLVPTATPTPVMSSNVDMPSPRNLAKLFSFVLLLAIIGLIGVLSYRVMSSFVLPLFLAALLVVIFRPVHEWILRRCGGRNSLAAGLTTAAILLVALGPVAWMVVAGVREGIELTHRPWQSDFEKLSKAREKFGLEMPFPEELADIQAQLKSLALKEDRTNSSAEVKGKQQLVFAITAQLKNFKDLLKTDVNDKAVDPLENAIKVIEILDRIDEEQPSTEESEAEPSPLSRLRNVTAAAQRDGGANPKDIDEYEEVVGLISDHYALARQTLMGGVTWAPIVEFVNPSEERIDQLRVYAAEKLRSWMLKLTGQTTSLMSGLLMQLFVFTVATFYFLADGPQMISSAMQLSPMDDKHEAEIISEFAKLSRAVVVATLLSAIVQGLLAGFGYFAVWGFDSLFVLIMLTTILAMIPFVGAAAVWVPACIYLAFIENRIPAAIGLAIYGACIVSMADNVIKPMVLKGQSNLHPLFALLSVLGGVGALGPIGVLVGPMVVAFLQSLLKILHKEMHGTESGVLDQRAV